MGPLVVCFTFHAAVTLIVHQSDEDEEDDDGRRRETERERQREEFFLLRHRSLSLFQFLNAFFGWHFAVDCSGTPNGFVCRKVGTFFAFIGVGFSDGFGFVVFLLYFLWFLLPFLWSGYFKKFPAVAVARRELVGAVECGALVAMKKWEVSCYWCSRLVCIFGIGM